MTEEARRLFLLLLGGALGTASRYYLSVALYATLNRPNFPYPTLFVNVTGSYLMGLLAELAETQLQIPPNLRIALLTGLLGGYTTYSSFSYETLGLLRDGQRVQALVNVAASVILGLAAIWAGLRTARLFC